MVDEIPWEEIHDNCVPLGGSVFSQIIEPQRKPLPAFVFPKYPQLEVIPGMTKSGMFRIVFPEFLHMWWGGEGEGKGEEEEEMEEGGGEGEREEKEEEEGREGGEGEN